MFVGDRMINSYPSLRVWGIRVSAIAFLGLTANHIIRQNASTGSDFAMAAVIGVFASIAILGPARIVLALFGFVHKHYRSASSSASAAAHRRRLEMERKAAKEKERQDQIEWERRAPEREQARREAELRQREEARNRSDAQKRRADARADCEMLYQLYAPEIASRFSRTALDDWMKKYMGDDQSPIEVEQRAEQLRLQIAHHREQVKPTPKFKTLTELATWFQQQKAEIDSLLVHDRLRRTLHASLAVRNAELMTELMDAIYAKHLHAFPNPPDTVFAP